MVCSGGAQSPSRSTWSGVYSAAQAERGLNVYFSTCSQCHGPDMSGIDSAPPLTGGKFAANWNGVTLGAMVERIRISMPRNAPGTLTRSPASLPFPVGEGELPRQAALLQTIAYEAYRP